MHNFTSYDFTHYRRFPQEIGDLSDEKLDAFLDVASRVGATEVAELAFAERSRRLRYEAVEQIGASIHPKIRAVFNQI